MSRADEDSQQQDNCEQKNQQPTSVAIDTVAEFHRLEHHQRRGHSTETTDLVLVRPDMAHFGRAGGISRLF